MLKRKPKTSLSRMGLVGTSLAFSVFLFSVVGKLGMYWSGQESLCVEAGNVSALWVNDRAGLDEVLSWDQGNADTVSGHWFVRLATPPRIEWKLPQWRRSGSFQSELVFPLWIPLAISVGVCLRIYSARRCWQHGRCECGYSLTGLTSERCPECGRKRTRSVQDTLMRTGLPHRIRLPAGWRYT